MAQSCENGAKTSIFRSGVTGLAESGPCVATCTRAMDAATLHSVPNNSCQLCRVAGNRLRLTAVQNPLSFGNTARACVEHAVGFANSTSCVISQVVETDLYNNSLLFISKNFFIVIFIYVPPYIFYILLTFTHA